MKDNFSAQAKAYARYRPGYPAQLFEWIYQAVPAFGKAWDCATGNGQVATVLAKSFQTVQATDISFSQISQAGRRTNIFYSVQQAEQTAFKNGQFDLVTVAQAIHWFDFAAFYNEVRRVTKPGAVVAVMGYGLPTLPPGLDEILQNFYYHVVGPYWDKERRYLEENYQSIPFPFDEIKNKILPSALEWDLDTACGFLERWSATAHYSRRNGYSPVAGMRSKFAALWPERKAITATFPVIFRLGQVEKF